MITPKDIEKRTMSSEKRESAKNDYIAFYIGRPLTYVLTIPFLYFDISPNTITYISFIPTIVGFILLAIGKETTFLYWGWFSFFLWSMLDGVDGNIARYKKQYSKIGDTLDASAGYFAMALIFFGAGIAASHDGGSFLKRYFDIFPDIYTILGGISGMCTIMPRLIMHKAMTSTGDTNAGGMKNRSDYGIIKIIALNITSIPGLVQILLLVCIFTNLLDVYTVIYFTINLVLMIISMKSIFRSGGVI